jgi:hypothetical protein
MEGPMGDPGSGESLIGGDSSNAVSLLLLSLSSWFCFFFVFFDLPLGFGVTSTDAAAADAAALDAAAADANRVSFFLGNHLQIDCPILLLLLIL